MIEGDGERWRELCELAVQEQDPAKLMALVTEINRILETKEQRLKQVESGTKTADKEPPTSEGS